MTLGCGGWGGNITSDNITPRHLLNVKRLAYEVRPAVVHGSTEPVRQTPTTPESKAPLPKSPTRPAPEGIPAEALAGRIDRFLASRGFPYSPPREPLGGGSAPEPPVEFVSEEDVRTALKTGRKLLIDEKTIITPAARDLGEAHKVFIESGWPR
jgi:acetaldehyde dehydrogenase (acetylating)